MQIAQSIAELRAVLREIRRERPTAGFVPTMGALHEGHLSLVRAAKSACEVVVVSIFVNPAQFGPKEDFAQYPRTLEADCALLEAEGVDVLFAPAAEEMYAPDAAAFVEVQGVSDRLDGASRPGHFRGVATVVAKFFHLVAPQKAFFGQKDAAQVAVLRRMVRDLNFDLELVVCPTQRDPDGLAMSSRNRYLSQEERARALVLIRTLRRIEERFAEGERDAERLLAAGREVLGAEPEVGLDYLRIDYLRIVDWETLEDVAEARNGALAAVAAHVGTTRLIDNVVLCAD